MRSAKRTGCCAATSSSMTRTREWLYAWLLLLPAATLLALFTHYPAIANLWHSFYSTPRGARPAKFIALALLMAVWVNGRLPGRGFLRLAYFTPTVLPMIAVANIWLFFYTPGYGLLEQVSGAFGFASHNWLGSKSTALPAL